MSRYKLLNGRIGGMIINIYYDEKVFTPIGYWLSFVTFSSLRNRINSTAFLLK